MGALGTELREVQSSIKDERNASRRAGDRAEQGLEGLIQRVSEVESKVVPDEIRGVVRNYRFGVNGGDVHPNGDESMPTHRFDLDVGQQALLHVVVGSDVWDPFVAGCNGEIGEEFEDKQPSEVWNGKRLICIRNQSYGRFVPERLLGEPVGSDKNSEELFKGDVVRFASEPSVTGEITGYNSSSGYIECKRSDRGAGGGRFDEDYGGGLFQITGAEVELVVER